MDIKQYVKKLIKTCSDQQITEVEVYYSSSSSTAINVVKGEVETFKLSNDEGINISGDYEGKNSVTYIEKFDDDALSEAASNLKETALYNNKTKKNADKNAYTAGSISVVASENNIKKNGHSFSINKNFEDINYDKILLEAIYEATGMLSASPIASGNYDIIIKNNAAANLFAAFMPVFYADAIKKNSGKFGDKINTQVAVKKLNIIEDSSYQGGKISRSFDDEGIKTYKKHLIEDGVLKNILKNSEFGVSTGNAFRSTYKDNISIAALNCCIEKGNKSTDDIALGLKEGIMITNIDGLNAGINTATGDFSLISNGYCIADRKIGKPINQITMAGNFYDLINNILDISDDVCTSDIYINFFESPSLLVKGLMIGGL